MSTPGRPGLRLRLAAPLFAIALGGLSLGCGKGPDVRSIYVVPSSLSELQDQTFFDHPWPSDLRLEDGSPRLEGYYSPLAQPIIATYIEAMKGMLDGFSPAAAGYVRFEGAIDPATLPATPADALDPGASVQLLDIDPASPDHGKRQLVSLQWRAEEGVYIRANTLAFMPTIGFPLRGHTRYALVVTNALAGPDGGKVLPSADLSAALGIGASDTRTGPAKKELASAVLELTAAGIAKEHVVHLAVFTTADPTRELFAVRDDVAKAVKPPKANVTQWQLGDGTNDSTEYLGSYGPSPNYQVGKLPFANYGDGGAFQIVGGAPTLVDTFNLRFSLTVPTGEKCPMPAEGFPIVLYAHGTGGDYRSYADDGTGDSLARQCLATMGVDQIFHGTRPGAPPDGNESTIELLFFNFENPLAARTNPRQSAIDEVQRARLFTETRMTVPAGIAVGGKEIRFDPTKVMYFGHSQGGLNGPLYLASDPTARGGVLSGSGALISIGLLDKTKPDPSVSALIKTVFLGLHAEEQAEADVFHPIISLAQSMIDVADPIHYARHIIAEPRPGNGPKSIYMTEGINPDGTGDSYAPPHGIEAHGLAIGLPLQLPSQHAIVEAAWGGPKGVSIPAGGLSGNLGGGNASGVIAQWAVPAGEDGHFVVFDVPAASAQAAAFLKNLGDDPKGRVPTP